MEEETAAAAQAKRAAVAARKAALEAFAALPPPELGPFDASAPLPAEGTLHVEYRRAEPAPPTTVHYKLALADSSEREVALGLWRKALVESGESWKRERLDGVRFELRHTDEQWVMPGSGRLELEFTSRAITYMAQYSLDLADGRHRRLAHTLAKRLAHTALGRASETILNATLDGAPLPVGFLGHLAQGDGDSAADVGAAGMLMWTYVVREVRHLSTRHFVFDLQRGEDAALAAALRKWSTAVPGENMLNVHHDGAPCTQWVSGEGILELDYVVVQPLVPLPPPPPPPPPPGATTAAPEEEQVTAQGYWRPEGRRLRHDDSYDCIVAQRLAQLAYDYPGDPWLSAVLPSGQPFKELE